MNIFKERQKTDGPNRSCHDLHGRKKRQRPRSTWIGGVARVMQERNLKEGDWQDRKLRRMAVMNEAGDIQGYCDLNFLAFALRFRKNPENLNYEIQPNRESNPGPLREWRKLHNTELHALHSSPDIIRNIKSRRLRWAGHVARMGETRNAYRKLVGRPEGKRPLGMPRRRWEDNITMDLRDVGYDDKEWINLAQDRDQWRVYVRAAMNVRVP
ncbi:hypothetical protein ANN_23657 [Periplaneta americana]|uniref:Uncharacterized protein n=1 Tax=Periplaneta americana TaxID=6978 RepID=A0ABQ8SN57_PERAM|nr:hypothetical protein ANN_23657 [Periplaneta americana]